ncbi:hypothetical protein O6P43_028323 [Quillaja saponaria]|uniref:Uncharacterized protein n=1 Tax=Quillaja saponaria TaxID=32244 RepID=A0AAD7PA10_QUISA|nr:hypothetical protein O6P43_028323 [Quillaja saponaria]
MIHGSQGGQLLVHVSANKFLLLYQKVKHGIPDIESLDYVEFTVIINPLKLNISVVSSHSYILDPEDCTPGMFSCSLLVS